MNSGRIVLMLGDEDSYAMRQLRLAMLTEALTLIAATEPTEVIGPPVAETLFLSVENEPAPTFQYERIQRPYGKKHRRGMRGGKHE